MTMSSSSAMLPEESDSDDDDLLNFRAFAPKPSSSAQQPVVNHNTTTSPTATSGIGADQNAAAADMQDSTFVPKSVSPSQHEHQEEEEEEEDVESPPKVPDEPQPEHETGDPREISLQRLENEHWEVPDMVMKITHASQLLWWVQEVKTASGGSKKRYKNAAAASKKKLEVYPCRLANDQETYLWGNELGDTKGKVTVQFIGIHHRYKEQYDAVPPSQLVRFDGIKPQQQLLAATELDTNDGNASMAHLDNLRLSEQHLDHYRLSLQRILKLSPVEQWMEVTMMQRVFQSIMDRMTSKRRLPLSVMTERTDDDDDDDDKEDSAAQFVDYLVRRTPQERQADAGFKDDKDNDFVMIDPNAEPETLCVGDVIYYYPPEVMAVDANMVGEVTIKGIDPKKAFCVTTSDGRGLKIDDRIIRTKRMQQGELIVIENPFVCDIEEYELVAGGDMAIFGFGGMQREAKAFVGAQEQIKAEMEKKFGAGSTDGLFHNKKGKRKVDTAVPEKTNHEKSTAPQSQVKPDRQKNDRSAHDSKAKDSERSEHDKGKTNERGPSVSIGKKEKPEATKSANPVGGLKRTAGDGKAKTTRTLSVVAPSQDDPADDQMQRQHEGNLTTKHCGQSSKLGAYGRGSQKTKPTLKSVTPTDLTLHGSLGKITAGRRTLARTNNDRTRKDDYTPSSQGLKKADHQSFFETKVLGKGEKQHKLKSSTGVQGSKSRTHIISPLCDANAPVSAPTAKPPLRRQSIVTAAIPRTMVAQARRREQQEHTDAAAKAVKSSPAIPRKRRHSEAPGPTNQADGASNPKSRRTSLCEPQAQRQPPVSQNRPRQVFHMTQEQLNLADEIMDAMNRRFGGEGSWEKSLVIVEKELGLMNYQDRFLKFITKDPLKLIRKSAHDETERHLRQWLGSQRRASTDSYSELHELTPDDEISI